MKIVTFSGIDGAGKSTQIASLRSYLCGEGIQVATPAFWDDVVMFSRFREFISHKAFGGDAGVGTPDEPLHRRDKNVTAWPVTTARLALYLADSLNLHLVVRKLARAGVDVAIFDRYIYDELANLPLNSRFGRGFANLLLSIAPRPDAAFLIDADPEAARARKPEYPVEFLVRNRESYLRVSRIAGEITVIEPLSIAAAEIRIREVALAKLANRETHAAEPLAY